MIENKEVMARNIQKYMDLNNIKAADICKTLGVKQNTFSDWVNAKTYPRINAIEMLARYFGVSKAALVEDHPDIDMVYTSKEVKLIAEYRKSDKVTQDAVWRLLAYGELIRKSREEN